MDSVKDYFKIFVSCLHALEIVRLIYPKCLRNLNRT